MNNLAFRRQMKDDYEYAHLRSSPVEAGRHQSSVKLCHYPTTLERRVAVVQS